MPEYVRRTGDLAHSFFTTFYDNNGPVDLPIGTMVTFEMRLLGADALTTSASGVVVSPNAPLTDPDRGVVRYDPVAQDMAVPGLYWINWRCQFPDPIEPPGYLQTFPESPSPEVLLLLPTI